MKFRKLAHLYLTKAEQICKIRTITLYESLYNEHIDKVLGDKDFESITTEFISDFLLDKSRSLSHSTIQILRTIIKNIANFTKVYMNIKGDFEVICRIKPTRKQVDALTKLEQMKLEQYIIDKQLYYNYGVIITLYTGLRIGELLALTWKDIDFENNTISITKTAFSIVKDNKVITGIDTPKSQNSNRIIPLTPNLVTLLKELRSYQRNTSEFVVAKPNGKQIKTRVYQKSFERLLEKLQIAHHGFHSLRHTFATRAMECDVDIKSLSEMLGHSNISITLNKYIHSSLEQKSKELQKMYNNIIC